MPVLLIFSLAHILENDVCLNKACDVLFFSNRVLIISSDN